MAGVGEASVKRFERTTDIQRVQTRVMFLLKDALEEAGITFLAEDNGYGCGARLTEPKQSK
jgi:hypothetical protein